MPVDEQVCVDLFTDRLYPWMKKYNVQKVNGKHKDYFTVTVDADEKNKVVKMAKRCKIGFRWYEKRWARSSNYRDEFFKHNQPPYRCRYCHKKLTNKTLVVDHIVPIAQVKKSTWARALLTSRGIQTVNDVRNLAPSCRTCNLRKGEKMGLWTLRGIFGQYTWFWFIYYSAVAGLLLIAVYAMYRLEFIERLISIF